MRFRLKNAVAAHVACLALAAVLAACGSSSDDGDEEELAEGALPSCDDTAEGEPCMDSEFARLCPVDTGWPGDELALCGPDYGEGLLFHYGPKDYDDPDEIAKYTLEGGGEDENCLYVRTPNQTTVFANGFHGRMRPGSHHLIVTITEETPDLVLNEPEPCSQAGGVLDRWVVGSQDPQIDVAVTGPSPPQEGDPEYGGAIQIPPNSILRIDMHYLNPTDKEILREAWIWLDTVPEEEVEVNIDLISWIQGSISVPPNSTGVESATARCRVPTDRYLGLVTGHFHENGTRFTVWHEPQDGEPEKIYETFDWENPGNGAFADRIENPPMDDPSSGSPWGARSGYLQLKEGDFVSFQCEFDNPTDETVTMGDTGADQMCNVFGFYFPSDGDTWDCSCLGSLCLSGLNF